MVKVLTVERALVTIGSMATELIRTAFAKRLNEVLDDHQIAEKGEGRQMAVSKAFGLTPKGVRKWLEGEGVPELTRVVEIAIKYGVCVEWLLTGRGEKQAPTTGGERESLSALQRRYRASDPPTKALIELCLNLPLSVPLPETVSPTLRNLLNGARMLAEQNLPRA